MSNLILPVTVSRVAHFSGKEFYVCCEQKREGSIINFIGFEKLPSTTLTHGPVSSIYSSAITIEYLPEHVYIEKVIIGDNYYKDWLSKFT